MSALQALTTYQRSTAAVHEYWQTAGPNSLHVQGAQLTGGPRKLTEGKPAYCMGLCSFSHCSEHHEMSCKIQNDRQSSLEPHRRWMAQLLTLIACCFVAQLSRTTSSLVQITTSRAHRQSGISTLASVDPGRGVCQVCPHASQVCVCSLCHN